MAISRETVELLTQFITQGEQKTEDAFEGIAAAQATLTERARRLQSEMRDVARAMESGTVSVEDGTEQYNKLQRELGETEKALGRIDDEVNQSGTRFTELASKLSLAKEAFAAVQQVAQVTIDTIKRGAEVQATANTFDNLTKSIGTTADVMLNELQTATHGTVSNFDLMQSANRFMSMGLAESAEEAAKLAETAVALGGAMGTGPNQAMEDFALLLANQSIPRLDTFGISSGKVRERVNELTSGINGLDRETAFLQATMEEAEKAMINVGDSSDNLTTDIARLEASTQNIKDAFSVAFAARWAPIIGGLSDTIDSVTDAQRDLDKAVEAGILTRMQANDLIAKAALGSKGHQEILRTLREEMEEQNDTTEKYSDTLANQYARANNIATQETESLVQQMRAAADVYSQSTDLANQYAAAGQEVSNVGLRMANRYAEQAEAARLATEEQLRFTKSTENLVDDYITAVSDMEDAQGEWVDVNRDTSSEIAEINAQLFGDIDQEQKSAFSEILSTAEEGGAEWLAAYSAIQSDLTESQRAELIARRAELEAANGELVGVYTGDAAAFEEAQARKIAAEQALTEAIKTEAFNQVEARLLAEGSEEGIEQIKALEELQVDLGLKTREAADEAIRQAEMFGQTKEVVDTLLDQYLEDGVLAQGESEKLAETIDLITESAGLTTEELVTLGSAGPESVNYVADAFAQTNDTVLLAQDSIRIMNDQIKNLPTEKVVTIRINTVGEVPGASGGSTSDVMEEAGVN